MGDCEYYMLNPESAVDYIRSKGFFEGCQEELSCSEIGDGNMNYIYRIASPKKSYILKQAGLSTRLSSGKNISRERNRREAQALLAQNEIWPGSSPQVYLYDEVMDCMVMEDLKDYQVMRQALLEDGPLFLDFGERITDILAANYKTTSDVKADHIQKKYQVKKFINPELCEITERLVFDEAMFNLSGSNQVQPENQAYVDANIYGSLDLIREAGKLKYKFMNFSQSMIHGDLHTGSIFVKEDDMKIFDSEFACYGPAGYDLGNVVANLLFAWVNADLPGREETARWIRRQMEQIPELFVEKTGEVSGREDQDAFEKILHQWYDKNILADCAGYAGMEIIRRTVGVAKVKDVTSLPSSLRWKAERRLLEQGIRLVLERDLFDHPSAYQTII